MTLQQIVNSGELDRGIFDPFFGEYFDPNIRDKFLTEIDVPTVLQGSGEERVEFSVYDSDLNLRHWDQSVDFDTNPEGEIQLDILQDIQDADLPDDSEYSARYNFFREKLGSPDGNKAYLQEISNDRRSIRVRADDNAFQPTFESFFGNAFGQRETKLVVNFGNNQYTHILNWDRVFEVDDNGNSTGTITAVIIRLQRPLQDSIGVGDEFWVDREFSFPYFDQFSLFRELEPEDVNVLGPPDFSVDVNEDSGSETGFESLDDLLSETSEEFAESAFGAGERVKLNVDYTEFSNFIHFSSAEERILNFRFKLRVLQDIQEEINELRVQGDTTGRSETLRRRADELIGSFDDYEQWLFETDDPEAYPKTDSNSLVELGSVEAQDWFERKLQEARDFDESNDAALRKQIPRFVREDDRNDKFVLFVDMVAQWFDVNWLYIEHFEFFTDRTENIFMPESLSRELSQVVGESFGFEMYNGLDAEELFDEVFDTDKVNRLFGEDFPTADDDDAGLTPKESLLNSTGNGSGQLEPADVVKSRGEVIENMDGITKLDLTRFQAQQQIWRRLLNTIIHKFKSKGTERSINALLSVFGIPRNSFVIREFGGVPDDPNQTLDATSEIKDSTAALEFFSEQFLEIQWDFTLDPAVQAIVTGATAVDETSAVLNGELVEIQDLDAVDVRFEWREVGASTTNVINVGTFSTTGTFSATLTGLNPNTDYEYKAVAESTEQVNVPTVDTIDTLFEDFPNATKSIEMRLRSSFEGGSPMKLVEIEDVVEARVEKVDLDEPELGVVVLEVRLADGTREVVRSSEVPFFDGRWNNVLLRLREGEPFIDLFFQRRSPFGAVTNERQLSVQIDFSTAVNYLRASRALVGGKIVDPIRRRFEDGIGFIGDLDQVMTWRENIGKQRFDDHTLAPAKYDFDNESLARENMIFDIPLDEIRDELMLRLDFDDPKNLFDDPKLFNEAPNKEFFGSVPANNWPDSPNPPWQFVPFERVNFLAPTQIGASTFFSTKIRIEDTQLNGTLDPDESVLIGELDGITQDSRKLGVFFSPTEAVNRDIFFESGVSNLNGLLADPRDQDGRTYSGLRTLSDRYWRKYDMPVDKQQFIQYIDQFYDALFRQLRKCVPARARLIDGVVIENDALKRDRVPVTEIDVDNTTVAARTNTGIEATAVIDPVAEQLDVTTNSSSNVTATSAELEGEVTQFDGFGNSGFVGQDATVGFDWREQGASSFDNRLEAGFVDQQTTFSAELTDLTSSTTYEFKATAEAGGTTEEGSILTFTTS